jgi:DTW domain-containing protein YfiP
MTQAATPDAEPEILCPRCHKIPALCVCAGVEAADSKTRLLILQHPQEQDRELGTARLAALHFAKAEIKVGLSWPNLTKVLGRPADPKRWGVLFLGPIKLSAEALKRPVVVLDRQTQPFDEKKTQEILASLDGVILIDGSWSQAKTLWWRNAWLLKSWRIVLNPPWPSRYGRFRKEPRRDSVSTLEAAALIMATLEKRPEIETRLVRSFEALLRNYRALKSGKPAAVQEDAGKET